MTETPTPNLPPLDLSGDGVQISVIMPLHDYRFGHEFMNTWVKHQTCPGDRYEVLVIGGPEHRSWEAGIRASLRPQDRLIFCEGARIPRYAEGIRQARGKVLLITEDHCVAHRRCLETVFEAFHEKSAAGMQLQCGHINRNALSEMEAEHDLLWGRHHAWNQFRARGTAVRKDVYEQSGGMHLKYHYFAEPALGIRLFESGYRFARTGNECVRHVNSFHWSGLTHDVFWLSYGEYAFRLDHPERNWDGLLGESPGWQDRRRWHRATHRIQRTMAWIGVLKLFPKHGSGYFLAQWLRLSLQQPRRYGLSEAVFLVRMLRGALRCLRKKAPRNAVFSEWLDRVARYAAFRFHLDHTSRVPVADVEPAGSGVIPADAWAARHASGFHALESWQGKPLVWSHPMALLWLKLHRGSWKIQLNLAPIGPARTPDLVVLWNGTVVDPSRVTRQADHVTVRVDIGLQEKTEETTPGALSWLVGPLSFPGDSRNLGIPIHSLQLELLKEC